MAYSMFPVQKGDLCSEIHCLLLSVQYKFFQRHIQGHRLLWGYATSENTGQLLHTDSLFK